MSGNRVLQILLAATIAVVTVAVTVVLMQRSSEVAPIPVIETVRYGKIGTVDASPFGNGQSMGAAPLPAQAASDGNPVFRVDEQGALLLDHDTKVRLDILMANLPENATAYELQTLQSGVVAALPQPAKQQALNLLETYARYLAAEARLNVVHMSELAMKPEDMFNKLIGLRRQHLGTHIADALFGTQEIQDRYGVQVAMVEADPALSAQEKIVRLDALESALPRSAGFNADLHTSRSALEMERNVAALRQQGASEQQVKQLRERHVGPEGAEAIGELESHKLEWEMRQQAFAQQRNLIAQMNLTDQQKQERIEALLRQIYPEEQIPAARALHQESRQ